MNNNILIISVGMYFLLVSYIFVQFTSILLDIVIPLNESRPRELLFPAEYFIDQQKYFYVIIIHIFMGLFFIGTSVIATESFSLANACHAFGLFKIARYFIL